MRVGVFTPLLSQLSAEDVFKKLKGYHIDTVELGTGNYPGGAHCKLSMLENESEPKDFKRLLSDNGVSISALSCHGNPLHPDEGTAKAYQEVSQRTIRLAEKLGVPVVVDAVSGQDQQITSGDDWNDTDPQWSPDGARIAFVSDRTGQEYDDSHNTDVWVISASGGALTKISDHAFEDDLPRWSPDGQRIVFAGRTTRRQFPKLYVADAKGAAPSSLVVDNLDLIPVGLHWGPGPNNLRFESGFKGTTQIFGVDLAGHSVTPVTHGERSVHAFDINEKAGVMTYLANDFEHLDDLYVAGLDGAGERQLTHVNAKLWPELDLAKVERLPYDSTDHWAIDGFLVKPLGFDPNKKYPMILSIHGGPAGQYGVDWYHEFQVYAARGYAVFFCNPRGSTGYGQKFERGIVNNWGGMDYQDIMAGGDAGLKQNSWSERDQSGRAGGVGK